MSGRLASRPTSGFHKTAGLTTTTSPFIRDMFTNVCRTRVGEVFCAKLDDLSSSFIKRLNECIVTISTVLQTPTTVATSSSLLTEDAYRLSDLAPSKFLLSSPPAPSLTQSGLGPLRAEASLQRFRLSIKQRIDSLTPLVESLYSNVESAAKSLRSDLDTIVESSEFFRSVIFPFRTSMALIIMTINYSSLHDTYLISAEGALESNSCALGTCPRRVR